MDVFEAMETCRAIRYLKPDPVPEELIEKVIYGATRASSPGNSQGWDFVVVTDRDVKQRLSDAIAPAFASSAAVLEGPDISASERRLVTGAMHLVRSFAEVPVVIVCCARKIYPPQNPLDLFVWSAVYPASQNLIVAARALGLGTTFTTLHSIAEDAFREVLQIPADVFIGTTIAMGYPDRPFGPVKRKPVSEVIHRDRW
jgi:nitroreductase